MDSQLLQTAMFLHDIKAEFISLIELGILMSALLFLFRYFQQIGVVIFMTLAVLVGNIQILSDSQFSFGTIPLGTLSFSSAFLATALINAHYGRKAATKAVLATFYAQVFFGLMMFVTLAYKPTINGQSYFNAMALLFSPSLRFFSASMISYLLAQMFEIYVFDKLKSRNLFTRFNLSVWLSALLDNTIFSFLAFYIFPTDTVLLKAIFFQYILGTYWIRVMISFLETPTIYFSYFIKARF